MKKIICIGSATKDIFLEIEHGRIIDNPGDLTAQKLLAFEFGAKIYAQKFRQEVGGSAVNVATGAGACGMRPFVFARSSKSEVGKWIIKQIGKRKLKKNYFQQTGGEESEIVVVITDLQHKDHVIFRTGDSVRLFELEKALLKFNQQVDWIYIGSQKEGWEEDFKLVREFAQEKKASIALNPSGFQIESNAKSLLKAMASCNIVQMNKDEAIELLQKGEGHTQDDIKYIFARLQEHCPGVIVVTAGHNGAYVGQANELLHIPTQAVKVVDTVGAGDAFASAFIGSYAENGDVKKALAWGIANSASVLSKPGATNGLLSAKQLRSAEKKNLPKINKIQ